MSRAGKYPIEIPSGVDVAISADKIEVKSDKNTQSVQFDPRLVNVTRTESGAVIVKPNGTSKVHKSMWGTLARRISNSVEGVSKGFEKHLELNGVGYRAQVSGALLTLSLGFSNPVKFKLPEGITVKVEGDKATQLVVAGHDKIKVGQIAGEIRRLRPPEPYKGKGVRYKGEFVLQKEGKKK